MFTKIIRWFREWPDRRRRDKAFKEWQKWEETVYKFNGYPRILLNRVRTPDGTVLTSWHRHDYVSYTDANGKGYMVDGGREYLRRSANGDEVDMSVYMSEDHHSNKRAAHWGTRGPNGDQPLKRIPICEMDSDHIRAVLETQRQIKDSAIEHIMITELEHRNAHL